MPAYPELRKAQWDEAAREWVRPTAAPPADTTTDTGGTLSAELQATAAAIANALRDGLRPEATTNLEQVSETISHTTSEESMAQLTPDEEKTLALLLKKQGAPAAETKAPTPEEAEAAREARFEEIYRKRSDRVTKEDTEFLREYCIAGLQELRGPK